MIVFTRIVHNIAFSDNTKWICVALYYKLLCYIVSHIAGLDGPDRTQKVELIPTDKFQRYSLAGYIDVQSVAPEERDMYPPARILDLKVTRTSRENQTITLEWTAVGDDLDKGKGNAHNCMPLINKVCIYSID